MTVTLALLAIALAAMSGGVGVFLRREPVLAQRAACGTLCAGAVAGFASALLALGGGPVELHLSWSLPLGAVGIRVDALSAFRRSRNLPATACGWAPGSRWAGGSK